MNLKDFKKTPFYRSYKHFIKTLGWDKFKKEYQGIVGVATLWLECEKIKKQIDMVIENE